METSENPGSEKQGEEEVLPCLLQIIDETSSFDSNDDDDKIKDQSISISMPPTPSGHHHFSQPPKRVFFNDHPKHIPNSETPDQTPEEKFYSQPMPKGVPYVGAPPISGFKSRQQLNLQARACQGDHRLRDTRFDSFKTWSGKLERQLSHLRGKPVEPRVEPRPNGDQAEAALPVDRYFDALQGPELDTLRASEELMLPEDKTWPFLLRFPISTFGICLGVSSQAILWKALATSPSLSFLHVSLTVNLVLWSLSIGLTIAIGLTYALKLIFYFEAVRREYYHPIRVNFFFAPFIALLFLALGVPPSVAKTLPQALWYVLMIPFLCLKLKIYGQWMSGGQRRLSKVANPSNHLSIVGNFVGALLGASMGLKEGPLFFFAVGLAHYTVLFVTLYQRLPTNETLPKDLHPVFFLFVAAPSVASMAWAKIQGSFDDGARIAFFIALFLYFSLAVRINFFRGIRFSLAWWAYTFPMTGAAIATITYSNDAVSNWVTRSLAIGLSSVATLTVTSLLVTTLIHAFVFRKLFPNDIAIAISDGSPKPRKKWPFHLRHASSETKDIEHYLKFVHSTEPKDLESSAEPPSNDKI